MSRIIAVLATLALAITLTTGAAAAPSSPSVTTASATSASTTTASASSMLKQLNLTRTAAKKKPLTSDATMRKNAQTWAAKLAAGTVSGKHPKLSSALPGSPRALSQTWLVGAAGTPSSLARAFAPTVSGDYSHAGVGWSVRKGKVTVVIFLAKYVSVAPYTSSQKAKKASQLFTLVNGTRTSNRKTKFKASPVLNAVAQKWADRMAHTGDYRHQPRLGSVMPRGHRGAAENIAWNMTESIPGMQQAWVKSPGHFRNLMGAYTHVGVAVARDKRGKMYGVQVFGSYASTPKR